MTQCIILAGGTWNPENNSKIKRSLAPYRLATSLKQAGYSVAIIDYCIELTTDEILQALELHLSADTLWVGFSSSFYFRNTDATDAKERMYYAEYSEVKRVKDYIRANSGAKLVYGGSNTMFYGGRDTDIDYYVDGFADVSVVDLTRFIDKGDTSPPFEIVDVAGNPITMLDSFKYPEPAMDSISTEWHDPSFNILPGEGLPIELARGCIFKCKFCSYPLLGKKKGTYLRPTEQVRDELIRAYEAHGTTDFYITDDTFNDDNDKLEALHRVFTSLPFKPRFAAYLRIDLINKFPHQAKLLQEMGLIGTYFGLETTNVESARAIGKGLHPNKVKDRLYWLKEEWNNRVNVAAGFILGLPYDTHRYFDDLISWCSEKDNPIDSISFYPLYLFKYRDISSPENLKRVEKYLSDFSINPEIYGYEFRGTNNITDWRLPSQSLTFDLCTKISESFSQIIDHRNKISAFAMISYLSLGIELDDLFNMTHVELNQKYNIPALNQKRIQEYKDMLLLSKE